MALGDRGVPIAVVDHLALLGEPEPAVDRAARLGQDRLIGGPTPPANGPASPVEHLEGDPAPPADGRQGALGLVQRPGRLEETALLVAVGVAQHHLLEAPTQLQVFPVDGQIENPLDDRRAVLQRFKGLEQRDDIQQADPLLGPEQPGLAGQEQDFQQMRRLGGRADDVRAERRGALLFEDGRSGSKRLDDLIGFRRKAQMRRDQRTGEL